ncbi:MAG: SAM-dependent methyltransferase, partial [Halobacteria archaeon]|nr:SAM-dependent methyltransferase [Halobacteria archaeon]
GGRVVIGDLIIFDESDTSREFYDPEVDDPSTVEHLVDVFEDNGFSVEHERLSEMTGVVEAVLR